MSNPDPELSQIDAEIERLRQARPKDEADPKCVEIDTGITGLQWLREKLVNSSGPQVMTGIGDQGQRVDVQAMREKWEKHKVYKAVPEGAQMMLHLLARGAQHAASPEDANALLEKLVEVLEFVWPTSSAQEHTAVTVGKIVVLVPKEAGVPPRHSV
jgi:hypothetical protein